MQQQQQSLPPRMATEEEGGGGKGPALLSESAYAAAHPGVVSVSVKVPVDDSNPSWNLAGQLLVLEVGSVMRTVKALKEQIAPMVGDMPLNKMQLRVGGEGGGGGVFLKDPQTLASYNLGAPGSGSVVELVTRSRGGRK